MKGFLQKVLLFAFVVLLVMGMAEAYVRSLPNPSKAKHDWMGQHSTTVTTLVLGNSHTFYGIRPALLADSAFSLAQVSQTYRYDLFLLRHYDMPRLRCVVLPLSYFSLYEDFEEQGNVADAIRYRLYMNCPLHSRLGPYGFELMGGQAFKEKLKSLWKPAALEWDSLGGCIYRMEKRKTHWDNGAVRAKEHTYPQQECLSLNRGLLCEIFEWCKGHGVRVVWVRMPASKAYWQHVSPLQEHATAVVRDSLLRRFGNVEYVDFGEPDFLSPSDFFDGDHLNTTGAEKLTRQLRPYVE